MLHAENGLLYNLNQGINTQREQKGYSYVKDTGM